MRDVRGVSGFFWFFVFVFYHKVSDFKALEEDRSGFGRIQ